MSEPSENKHREPVSLDQRLIPVRWIPTLTMEEAGELLSAFKQDPNVMPEDYCRDEARKASCPMPVKEITPLAVGVGKP